MEEKTNKISAEDWDRYAYEDCEEDEDILEEEDYGFLGSSLEAQLTRVRDRKKCRMCEKDLLEEKEPKEQFCNDECKKEFENLLNIRLKVGEHDLKIRGFD